MMKTQKLFFIFSLIFVLGAGTAAFGGDYDTYEIGMQRFEFDAATVYYPTGSDGPFPATTMSGGWTNTKEDMIWICEKLVQEGFIVICFTPQRRWLALPYIWERGANASYRMLEEENKNPKSPIHGKVDTDRIAMSGFSMGGGGVINAANYNVTGVKVTVAMAPWELCTIRPMVACDSETEDIKTPIFIFGGTKDLLVYDNEINNMYETLPNRTEKLGVIFEGMNHGDLFGPDSNRKPEREKVAPYMIAFLKVYLTGDSSYQTYLDGAELDENIDNGWFSLYKFNNSTYVE
jgi:dienelactone hydrolase